VGDPVSYDEAVATIVGATNVTAQYAGTVTDIVGVGEQVDTSTQVVTIKDATPLNVTSTYAGIVADLPEAGETVTAYQTTVATLDFVIMNQMRQNLQSVRCVMAE
jgi:biotin carboxyl carrier protein